MPIGLIVFHADVVQPRTYGSMPPIGLILILLLVAFPLLELAVLIKVGSMIGVFPVLALIIGTFIAGVTVVRHQGLGVARRFIAATRSGQTPVEPMIEGMLLVFAGSCLIAPGLITDVIGLVLLIPPLRRALAKWIATRGFSRTIIVTGNTRANNPTATSPVAPTIEGEFQRLDEQPKRPPRAER